MTSDASIRAGLARLLMKHRTSLYGYILACVRNHEDAAQILQKVAMAVAQWSGPLPSEQEFLPWAREIAETKVLVQPRAGPRDRSVDLVLVQRLAEAAERVEKMRPIVDYQAALLSCVEKLPVKSRLLLAMRHDGSITSMDQLATRLGRSVQAAYAVLKQVKGLLRDCVGRRVGANFDHGITRSK